MASYHIEGGPFHRSVIRCENDYNAEYACDRLGGDRIWRKCGRAWFCAYRADIWRKVRASGLSGWTTQGHEDGKLYVPPGDVSARPSWEAHA